MLRVSAQKPDNADDPSGLDGFERLSHGGRATDFDNVLHADMVGGQRLGGFTPSRIRGVVDYMIGPKFFEDVCFGIATRCSDDLSPGCLGELGYFAVRSGRMREDGPAKGV
jgi:hypothetical protein